MGFSIYIWSNISFGFGFWSDASCTMHAITVFRCACASLIVYFNLLLLFLFFLGKLLFIAVSYILIYIYPLNFKNALWSPQTLTHILFFTLMSIGPLTLTNKHVTCHLRYLCIRGSGVHQTAQIARPHPNQTKPKLLAKWSNHTALQIVMNRTALYSAECSFIIRKSQKTASILVHSSFTLKQLCFG